MPELVPGVPGTGVPGPKRRLLGRLWVPAVLVVGGLMFAATALAVNTRIPFPIDSGIQKEAIYRTFFFHVPTAISAKFMLIWVFLASVLWLLAKPLATRVIGDPRLAGLEDRLNPPTPEEIAAAGRVARIRDWLYRKRDLFDRVNLAGCELGLLGYGFVLISGMMWGDAAWGTPWNWEPRLVAAAITWFLVLGMLLLRSAVDDPGRRQQFAAVFGVVIFCSLPFVTYATTWFATQLHPAANDANMAAGYRDVRWLFLFCIAAIGALFHLLGALRVRAEGLRRRARALSATE